MLPLINSLSPSIRVEAGPGTGKTFGLRRRVLRLLHPQGVAAAPSSVLVCAFNRVIREDLEREIRSELKDFGLSLPTIQTIHSLCAELEGGGRRFVLPHEIQVMVYDIRERYPDLAAQFEGKFFNMMRAVREHQAELEAHPDLAARLREWLADHEAAMIGDLPRAIERRLANGDLALPTFQHVLVDEFQDLTEGEARLVTQLRAEGGTFIALGDRKQSIYAFRGNQAEGLKSLDELMPAVDDLTMTECQRCPRDIVQLANSVAAEYGQPLSPLGEATGQVHQVHHKSPEAEAKNMAATIADAFKRRPGDRHLVLVTRRKWGYDLREALAKLAPDLRTQTVFAEDVLETWPAREAFLFLGIVANPLDKLAMRAWIAYRDSPAGKELSAPDRHAAVYLPFWKDGGLNRDLAMGIVAGTGSKLSGKGQKAVFARLTRLRGLLEGFDGTRSDVGPLASEILDPENWVDGKPDSTDVAVLDLERMNTEVQRYIQSEEIKREQRGDSEPVGLTDIVSHLRHRIATRDPLAADEDVDIPIVTLWGAKGLTADFVYVTGLVDEALPGPHDPESTGLTEGDHLGEQTRLLYVSLTRARNCLVLSRPQSIARGKARALRLSPSTGKFQVGFRQNLQICRFLRDVPQSVLPNSEEWPDWGGIQF